MKKITKEYELLTFDELPQEAKDKAREDYNQNNYDYFLADCMAERLHELLEENNIIDLNDTSKPGTKPTQVFYSLSHSQGDGAMFEGDFEWNGYFVTVKHSGSYYHENSKTIDITDEEGNEPETDEPEKAFNDIYVKICKELEKYGYDYIEHENSEENFREICEANNYTFLLSGEMMNG